MTVRPVQAVGAAMAICLIALTIVTCAGCENRLRPTAMKTAKSDKPPVPYIRGAFQHVLDPPGQKAARKKHSGQQWYINDHCFYVAADKTVHWFGITNPYPTDRGVYAPGSHRHIGHATASDPFGPWKEHPHAIALPKDTSKCIGACFVARHGGQYVMIYGYNTGFHIAVSNDLHTWKTLDRPKKISLGRSTRDPCIVRLDDGSYLLYATAESSDGKGAIGLATSSNLIDWQVQPPAMVSDLRGSVLESPCVFRRGEWFYLFINHSHHQYQETIVFASRNPRQFDWKKPFCTLFAHAAEVFEFKGVTYISHCGIEDRHWDHVGAPYGMYLAELDWLEP